MTHKTIDTKMKEMYINAMRLEDNSQETKTLNNFWNSMNIVAITNMSMQQIKYA